MTFSTDAGLIDAVVEADRVRIGMPDPSDLNLDRALVVEGETLTVSTVNTGVPHVIVFQDNLNDMDVVSLGRAIRHHAMFAPVGTNANFIAAAAADTIKIRTYERGVEDETLACGTGSVAAAIISACKLNMPSPVRVQTRSGSELNISFKRDDNQFFNIGMEGDARVIYSGELWPDAWEYIAIN
jgi:diaminopimelate epimerase